MIIFQCPSLLSLPNVSKWNKNLNFTKNDLTKINIQINKFVPNNHINYIDNKKIIFLGYSPRGKSALISRLVSKKFEENTPTILTDNKIVDLQFKQYTTKLLILDTNGYIKIVPIISGFLNHMDGYIFALDNIYESLEYIKYFFLWKKKRKYYKYYFSK